mgnify:CR=1 FL=1
MKKILLKNLGKSLKQVRLKLLVPDMLYFMLGILLVYLFGAYTELSLISQEEIYLKLTENFSKFVGSLVTMLLIGFFVGARLKSFKMYMALKASRNEKFHLIESYKSSAKFFWRVVSLKVMSFLLLLIGFTLALMAYVLLEKIHEVMASVVAVIIIITVFLALFFRDAALFNEDTKPQSAIAKSYRLFKKKLSYVFVVSLIILIMNFIFVSAISYLPENQGMKGSLLSWGYVIILFLISIWTQLFIFNIYAALKGKNITQTTSKKRKSKL